MAGICCFGTSMVSASYYCRITNPTRCCLNPSNNHNSKNQTPQFLKFSVNGVTEILRFFTSSNNNRDMVVSDMKEELLISGVDDVLAVLKSDYDKAYFVSGLHR